MKRTFLEDISDEMTAGEAADIIDDCINKLEAIGPEFKIDWDLVSIGNFFDATNCLGNCALGVFRNTHKFGMEICWNGRLLKRSLKDLLINNIYHEFCHYYQNRDAIAKGIFMTSGPDSINPKASSEDISYYVGTEKEKGHSPCWLSYVNKVQNALNPKIPLSAFVPEDIHELFIDSNKEDIKFEIVCDICDYKDRYVSLSPNDFTGRKLEFLITLYIGGKLDAKNNLCPKCDNSLYINIVDKEFEKIFDNLAIRMSMQQLLGNSRRDN